MIYSTTIHTWNPQQDKYTINASEAHTFKHNQRSQLRSNEDIKLAITSTLDTQAHNQGLKASSNLKINSTLKSTFIVNLQIVFFVSNQDQL
jgi:hypothetical protein